MLGILGGMGPLATVGFLDRIYRLEPATKDQDHIPSIAYIVPQIPDRSAAIVDGGPSPLPALQIGLAQLEASGVDHIAMPCVTAHFWYAQLQAASSVPVHDMVAESLAVAALHGAKNIGLLATRGTVISRLFHNAAEEAKLSVLTPTSADQERVDRLIGRIKAGKVLDEGKELEAIAGDMWHTGVDLVVLGCTELSLIDRSDSAGYIDPLDILAQTSVTWHRVAIQGDESARRSGYSSGNEVVASCEAPAGATI